ncbi:MAG: phosphoribosyl-AMP cyclohydrolase [Planctomycetota bacterium]
MKDKQKIEEGIEFIPKYDEKGLITAVAQDAKTNQILMAAFMNKDALETSLQTGGHRQKIEQILVDCDQDCLILKVSVDAGQCHVGYKSCFYRAIKKDSNKNLELIAEKVFNPQEVYKK